MVQGQQTSFSSTKELLLRPQTNLSPVIQAVLIEDRIDLWILKGSKQQCLPIIFGPVIQTEHSHPWEIHPMRFQRQQVNVGQNVL